MKENNENNASGGIGFVGLLTITFIVLKLLKVINWSWLWVLSPVWISFGLGFIFILFALVYAGGRGE
jgi:hypothetical protein